jgi:hypothetical protein
MSPYSQISLREMNLVMNAIFHWSFVLVARLTRSCLVVTGMETITGAKCTRK